MSTAPSPEEVYDRAKEEGRRRLGMPVLEQVATGFIAGVTIVFGIVGLGVTHARVAPDLGDGVASVLGAAAFGIGLVFLVVGRSELFSENFFDPVAATMADEPSRWGRLARLWVAILVFNLVGGALLVVVLTVPGALPEGSPAALVHDAEQIAAKSWSATLARAVLAGTLITLLSYLLAACSTTTARILVSFAVGFLLALGPFDHVIVSVLQLFFGLLESSSIGWSDLGRNLVLATTGNVAGGVLLITLTHSAQVTASRAG